MDTKITREDLCITVETVYDKPDGFIFDVEANMANGFEVFCSIHESPEDSDVCILDISNGLFVSWYKLSHLGRDIKSNIPDLKCLRKFIEAFKQASGNFVNI